jgi:hypothetical protein
LRGKKHQQKVVAVKSQYLEINNHCSNCLLLSR